MSQTITVNVVTSVSTGPTSGYFILDGDFTSLFFPGFKFILSTGLQNLYYTTVSSILSADQTQVNVDSAVYGSIVATGSLVVGTPPFVSDTYMPVTLVGGHGSGAQATVVVVGPGPVNSLGAIAVNSGYANGTYTAVPLTLGTGTGAEATIIVSGGFVAQVIITNGGTGYAVGDVLSAAAIFDGVGLGSGFSVPVATVLGTLTSATVTNAGVGYQVGDVLTFGGPGYGTGSSITVVTVTSTELGTIRLNNNEPMFSVSQNVYVINSTNTSCQSYWWTMNPTYPSIPAVQSGTILGIIVAYTNSNVSPTITYQVRVDNQPGVVMLDQSVVFIDKQTAITAYEAMSL